MSDPQPEEPLALSTSSPSFQPSASSVYSSSQSPSESARTPEPELKALPPSKSIPVSSSASSSFDPNVNMNMNLNLNLNMDGDIDTKTKMNSSPIYISGPSSPISKQSKCPSTTTKKIVHQIVSSDPAHIPSIPFVSSPAVVNSQAMSDPLPTKSRSVHSRSRSGEEYTRVRVQDLLNVSCSPPRLQQRDRGMQNQNRLNNPSLQPNHYDDELYSRMNNSHYHSNPKYLQEGQMFRNPDCESMVKNNGHEVRATQSEGLGLRASEMHHIPHPQHGTFMESKPNGPTQQESEQMSQPIQTEFLCQYRGCHRKFSTSTSLLIHQRRSHAPPTAYVCRLCNSSFSTSPNLNKHIKSVHDKFKPFQCHLCSATFAFRDGLQRHVRMVHDVLRPYACKYCTVRFKSQNHMAKHIWSRHPDKYISSGGSQLESCEARDSELSQNSKSPL